MACRPSKRARCTTWPLIWLRASTWRLRLAVKVHVRQHDVAEFKQLQAKTIAITLPLLVEKADISH